MHAAAVKITSSTAVLSGRRSDAGHLHRWYFIPAPTTESKGRSGLLIQQDILHAHHTATPMGDLPAQLICWESSYPRRKVNEDKWTILLNSILINTNDFN